MKNTLLICGALSILMMLATISGALAAQGNVPGQMQTAKGTVEVTADNSAARANPYRPMRELAYQLGPRQAYRQGDFDYYNRRKNAREEMRPEFNMGIRMVAGSKSGSFKKTVPEPHPYTTSSNLRQNIQTMGPKKVTEKLAVIKQTGPTTKGGE